MLSGRRATTHWSALSRLAELAGVQVCRERVVRAALSGRRQGSFNVAFILGDKAMRAARQAKLPQRIVKALDEAPKYPEGTGVRLEVKSSRDIGTLKKLTAIKLAN